MSDTKKYYWLKLKRDFFKRHDIKIIESMDNGKDYVLFYLKLLLESVDHNGELRFSETVPYNDKMLSTITDTNIDIVRSAVKIFSELGMMERFDDGTLYMEQVNTMLGYETSDAIRMRELREKKAQLLIAHGEGEQCSETFKNRSPEKDIELDKESDKDIKKEDNSEIPNITSKPKREKKEKEEKKTYGTFKNVFLSDTEYNALKEAYTETVVLAGIEAVSKYVQGNTGKHYSNFNKVMLSWGIEAGKEAIQSGKYNPIQKQKEYVKQEKQVCPKCGKPIEFGQCVDCGIFVGIDGKEVIL